MNKIFNKVGLIGMLLLIWTTSCENLDKNPTDQLSAETFYTSKNSIDMALTGCYGTMQDCLFTWNMPMYDCLTDNGYCSEADFYSVTNIGRGPINSLSGGYVNTIYTLSYSSIARYNIFLKTLAAYNGSDLDATTKTQYEAEIRLMRAMKYFDLYKIYGSVPLVTEPLTIENQYQPKASAADVLAQVKADVDFAIASLPDVPYKNTVGHLVKSAAQVLKARVLLFDAYSAPDVADPAVMAEVKAITGDIINKNYYSISPSFRGLFCGDLGQQNGNPEFVFTVNYLGTTNYPMPGATSAAGNNQLGVAAWYLLESRAAIWPLPNFANEFEFKDGTPFSESNPLYDATNVYKNRDPRMSKTIFTDVVTFENGFTTGHTTLTQTKYNYYKGISGSDAKDIYANQNGSSWPSMRYAEVLLMYAEAANEVSGPDASVYSAINQIRNRADILMPPLTPGLSQSQMRTAIRHERRVELAFEGFRYDDLKRWKIATSVLNMPASESVIARTFVDKNYHLPLPQSEIDKNHGVLVQNPDYQ